MTGLRYIDVCSGISAPTMAWKPLGWQALCFAEIEPAPRSVLAHHYPDVPLNGDFTQIRGDEYGPVDLLVGGTPCQSFSVAGLRGGLADARGNLALEFLKLADRSRARWVVWENVPGVFSSLSHDAPDLRPPQIDLDSGDGPEDGEEVVVEDRYDADEDHALACFLAGLSELGYGWAYRVLDAQFAGVPQRRRRVFVVGYSGDWRRAAAVLFERHSLSGHPAPRREAREGIAVGALAGTSPGGGWRVGADEAAAGQLSAFDGQNLADCGDLSATLDSGSSHGNRGMHVAHALRAEGFDASEDGTGRGTPIVPVHCFDARQRDVIQYGDRAGPLDTDAYSQAIAFDTTQISSAANYSNPKPGDPCHPLAAGAHPPSVAIPLLEIGKGTSSRGAGPNGSGIGNDGDPMFTLQAGAQHGVAYGIRSDASRSGEAKTPSADAEGRVRLRNPGLGIYEEVAPTVDASQPHTVAASAVRRLTPRECEALQGFPPDFTLVPHRDKPMADGPRYRMLGNSMAVPVIAWIGERIAAVEAIDAERATA